MPKLIRLYLTCALIGFALSAVFLGLLAWLNIAGLGHLVLQTASGGIAAVMLFVTAGIVFAGVQFALAIIRRTDYRAPPRGVLYAPHVLRAVPVKVAAKATGTKPRH